MARKYFTYIAPVLLFIALFADGQISTVVSDFLPVNVVLTSHVLLIIGLFCAHELPLGYSLFLFMVIGFVQDVYYLHVIGVATTLLPLVVYLMYYFYQSVHFKLWLNWLILLVTIFVLEFGGFLLARLFHLTNLSVFIFVVNNLLPSLALNTVLLLVCEPIGVALFGITKKT